MKPPITAASTMTATLAFAVVGLVAMMERAGAFVASPITRSCFSRRDILRTSVAAVGSGSAAEIRSRQNDGGGSLSVRSRAGKPLTMGLWRRRRGGGGGRRDGGYGGEMGKASGKNQGTGGAVDGRGGGGSADGAAGEPHGEGHKGDGVSSTGGNDVTAGAVEAKAEEQEKSQEGLLHARSESTTTTSASDTSLGHGEASTSGEKTKNGRSSSSSSSSERGGAVKAPSSAAAAAETARRRMKRARVALEEALDELGRSAIDELGLAPPAYMDLDLTFPSAPARAPVPVAKNDEGEGEGGEGEGKGWLGQWRKRGGGKKATSKPEKVLERFEEAVGESLEAVGEVVEEGMQAVGDVVEEGLEAVGEAVEEGFEAVGETVLALDERVEEGFEVVEEGVLALDDRVERARASVETALNELGLAVPSSESPPGAEDTSSRGEFHDQEQRGKSGKSGEAGAKKGPRWWMPERLRPTALLEEELDRAGASSPPDDGGDQRQQQRQQRRQKDKAAGLGRSLNMPLPSIQSQRAVAERAVRRAKVALGTAIDDLGLTPPPVGSALERFLHADEVLGLWKQEEALEDQMPDGDELVPGTDIGIPERRIWVVTTAALPWMTGTSVNPLLRAAYLSRGRDPGKVTLMIPWLGPEDQHFVLPEGRRFEKREDQEAYIREWLRGSGMTSEADDLGITWYDARYHQIAGCIFPMGDITRLIPDDEADVCIMEEPEHLNWFRATGVNWSKKFTHVVGVIHTNYVHYTMADTTHWASGRVKAPFARAFNKIMARAYCDKVIKLSATLQRFAEEKETVTNVHGVRENFLIVGDKRAEAAARGTPFEAGDRPYFLGKMLWEKGYDKLWDLLEGYQLSQEEQGGEDERSHQNTPPAKENSSSSKDKGHVVTSRDTSTTGAADIALSAYGSGPDSEEIRERAESMGLAVEFHPATDHAELSAYKTFVNPSESEVLCTTVAEALAMGKFVIIAEHASNEFFYQFPNTLKFKTQEEFNEQLSYSIANDPQPLTPEQRHVLGWSAATDRLVDSAKVTVRESLRRRRELDEAAWLFHYYLGSGRRGDRIRKIMAGGVAAEQNAHMEMVLKAEDEAMEMEIVASAAEAVGERGGGREEGAAAPAGGQQATSTWAAKDGA